jgi:hypothetical protein
MLNITLTTIYQSYPLESLSLSYLIFSMDSELEITSLYNITYVPPNVNTYLGISAVAITQNLY